MTTEEKVEPTIVLFRVFQGEVLALFPAEAVHMNPWMCSCYAHMGQHGSADVNMVIHKSRRATPEEYADLKRELEQRGYVLKIMLRNQYSNLKQREATIAEWRRLLVKE